MAGGRETGMMIEMAHEMFRDGDFEGALGKYSDALRFARSTPQKIALHSNRAACFLKLQRFNLAAQECTAVLQLDHNHVGALILRAQTLVTLKDYHSALFDVSRLVELNPTSEEYLNFESRLKTQLSLAPIPEAEEDDNITDDEENDATAETLKSTSTSDTAVIEQTKPEELKVRLDARKSITAEVVAKAQRRVPSQNDVAVEGIAEHLPKGWKAIPKPKGHAALDYARWDRVEDGSGTDSDDADDEQAESLPQYRFRVKTAGAS